MNIEAHIWQKGFSTIFVLAITRGYCRTVIVFFSVIAFLEVSLLAILNKYNAKNIQKIHVLYTL